MSSLIRSVLTVLGLAWWSLGGSECMAARQFTILGDQIITVPADEDDQPWMAEAQGFVVDAIGLKFTRRDDGSCGVSLIIGIKSKRALKVTRILVEDVTGSKAVAVGVDEKPAFPKKLWKGTVPVATITAASPTWLYEPGDTWLVFRITISTQEKGNIVLYQPGCFELLEKFNARNFAEADSYRKEMLKLHQAAAAVLAGRESLKTITVVGTPTPGEVKGLMLALRQAQKNQLALAVASRNVEYVEQLLRRALENARPGQYSGVTLAIAAPEAANTAWDEIGKDSGLAIVTGGLND